MEKTVLAASDGMAVAPEAADNQAAMPLTELLPSPLLTQATTSSAVDLSTMFGLDADQVLECCQGGPKQRDQADR